MAKKKSSSKPALSKPKLAYQFKITLLESEPKIWRRIQIQDCTLDELHEHNFDPETFDPSQATKAMKQGLPDWKRAEAE